MKRVTPQERVRKQIEELMTGSSGTGQDGGVAGQFMRLAVQRLIQEVLEAERTDFVGRERYERRQAGARGLRNGYEPKTLRTSGGKVPVEVPQVRDAEEPFRSEVLGLLGSRTEELERLAVEMYARGLSTRDIEDSFVAATGKRVLSRSSVSEITEVLWEEFEAFQQRDLSEFELECLFLDGLYESLRLRAGAKEAVLCAWGILRDGRKVLLHMMLGNKEDTDAWLELLRNMVERGLVVPLSITADGAPGLIKAIERVYAKSLRIRCWAHKMRNIESKLPRDVVPQMRAEVYTVRDAATYDQGLARAQELMVEYRDIYPSAMACLGDDLEASLNHLKLPARLRQMVRTTNLLERTFEEERRRSKVIPRFFSEKSCLKLAFAVLRRASERWARVRFSSKELEQLDTLRASLGLVPRETNAESGLSAPRTRCA
jgi:putative transposase